MIVSNDITGGALVQAINIGGDDYIAVDGTVFEADAGPTSETGVSNINFRTNMDFAGTDDDLLYKSYRFTENNVTDGFEYAIAVPENGTYIVKLYIAEIFFASSELRAFDITAEGAVVVDELDPVAQFGPVTGGVNGDSVAGVLTLAVDVQDGELNLGFLDGGVNNALVNGLEVRAADDDPIDPPSPVFTTKIQGEDLVMLVDADGDSIARRSESQGGPTENTPTGLGKVDGVWQGAEGEAYLDLGNDAADVAGFEYIAAEAADATLTFRYGNGSAPDRPMQVFVNGVLQGTVAFPSTTEWFNWTDIAIDIDLVAGLNTITFSQTGGSAPNIDAVTLETTAAPADDEPPVFTTAPAAVTLNEGETAVADFEAEDPDGQTVTFSLAGADADAFAIDENTGALSFDPDADFENPTDAGEDNVYNVDVVANAGSLSTATGVEVTVLDLPNISTGTVADGDTDVDIEAGFNFNFKLAESTVTPTVFPGIDETTIDANDTVTLVETATGTPVQVSANGSGGNDALSITPLAALKPNTEYTLTVDGVFDLEGRKLEDFSLNFTTGADDTTVDPLEPKFIVNDQATIENVPVTSLEFSPDGSKVYAASVFGTLYRWDRDAETGELSNQQSFTGLGSGAVIGIAFDPNSPNDLWLTKNLPVGDEPDFTG